MQYTLQALLQRRLLFTALALGGLLFLSALSGCLNSADKPDSARAPKPDTIKIVHPDSAPPQPLRDIIKPGTGKLAGQVFDVETGRGVPYEGVVIIKGTKLGTVTDSVGVYFIINIPPGKYTVQAQAFGYIKGTKKNVKIRPDITTVIDFKIKQFPNIDTIIRWDLVPRPGSGGNRH